MKGFVRIITAVLTVAAMTAQVFAASLPAQLTYNDWLNDTMREMVPVEQEYRNPNMTYEPYTFVRGGVSYADFNGLLDFGQFAKLDGMHIATYPLENNTFRYLGRSNMPYTYKSEVIDYIGASAAALAGYKARIRTLGYTNPAALRSVAFDEYVEQVRTELSRDPNFVLDRDGIFVMETLDSFYWLLIGRSVTNDAFGRLTKRETYETVGTYLKRNISYETVPNEVPCVEFRFYSLAPAAVDPRDFRIVDAVNEIIDVELPARRSLPTPNAANELNDVELPARRGLPTPNAANELIDVELPVRRSLPTPNALDDLR